MNGTESLAERAPHEDLGSLRAADDLLGPIVQPGGGDADTAHHLVCKPGGLSSDRVPQLGTQEVRAYLMLLFIENSNLDEAVKEVIRAKIAEQLKQTWQGKKVDRAFVQSLHEANGVTFHLGQTVA